ncbi:hypothetical protein [Flavivirga spongiicola]|uniref:Uncharacterized protein n=1 Tax=Flavivirga spongiicola TaxID=421621 RepID=A0ABU7XVV8_9FLAO|nr:hypothetical protein [Flavivirga sp. MEBiC05379]MDO5978993.1 hypothetical protein [Flavivirga sp. MEBiC05379]
MASYKRNNYKYIAGHYQKQLTTKPEGSIFPVTKKIEGTITSLENRVQKMDKINVPSIANAALGSFVSNTAVHGVKRLFTPKTLPATKGDIDKLKKDINEIKRLLNNKSDFDVY